MHNNNVFIHKLIKAIADSLIKIFIPLYILKKTNNINMAMIYLILFSSFVMIFMTILKKLIQRYSLASIIIHFIPTIAAMYLLSLSTINIYLIIFASILMALSQTLYSVPINILFTFSDAKANVCKFEIPTNIGKLIFTLCSGLMLANNKINSFLILSSIATTLYICSVIPLIISYNEIKFHYLNKEEITNKVKINKWFILFHISFGLFQPVMDNIIPLYLYMNDLSFQSVTIIIVLIELIKIFTNYFANILIKHNKELLSTIIGSIMFFSSAILMLIFKNKILLYVTSTISSICFPLVFVVMFKKYCLNLSKNKNVFYGLTKRDLDIFSFRPLLYSLSLIGFGLYPTIIMGICCIPLMITSEIKILNNKKKMHIN